MPTNYELYLFCLQVKPKSKFIYYHGEDCNEKEDEIPDEDVLKMEPVIPLRPR